MNIDTGIKFFSQKILIESTGDDEVDAAIKTLFHDDYRKTAPLSINRPDSRIVLAWIKKK